DRHRAFIRQLHHVDTTVGDDGSLRRGQRGSGHHRSIHRRQLRAAGDGGGDRGQDGDRRGQRRRRPHPHPPLKATQQWNYPTRAASLAPPSLDPWSNVVLTGSNDNKLHGMYEADGAAAISPFTTGGPIQTRPAVLPAAFSSTGLNVAYVTSQDGF